MVFKSDAAGLAFVDPTVVEIFKDLFSCLHAQICITFCTIFCLTGPFLFVSSLNAWQYRIYSR